jgi:tRNA pseudouridine38-40 synthase
VTSDETSEATPTKAPSNDDAPRAHVGVWRVVLEYDGGRFCGWERQKNGLGVQEVVEDVLFRLTGERVVVEGSGRTDAGVHALGQTASFRLRRPTIPRKLRLALNALLPAEVGVVRCEPAADDFHARFRATSKTYRYTILNGPVRRPLLRDRTFHLPRPLDVARMAAAAKLFEGTHDFRAFAKEAARRKSCVRTIFRCDVEATPLDDGETKEIRIEVDGSGFLYNMVRILTGTLVDVGLSRRAPESIAELLRDGRRVAAGFTVPPQGLCLVRVAYDGARRAAPEQNADEAPPEDATAYGVGTSVDGRDGDV